MIYVSGYFYQWYQGGMRKTHGLIHPVFKQVIGSLLSDGVSLLNSSSILIASVAVADRPDSSNVSVCFLMINFNYLKEKGMKKKTHW